MNISYAVTYRIGSAVRTVTVAAGAGIDGLRYNVAANGGSIVSTVEVAA